MISGIVKWFSNEKGYGFILAENKEYFVHHKQILGQGYKSLTANEKVQFVPAKNEKGVAATQVSKII